jgi:hypothetical protein
VVVLPVPLLWLVLLLHVVFMQLPAQASGPLLMRLLPLMGMLPLVLDGAWLLLLLLSWVYVVLVLALVSVHLTRACWRCCYVVLVLVVVSSVFRPRWSIYGPSSRMLIDCDGDEGPVQIGCLSPRHDRTPVVPSNDGVAQ